MSEAIVTEDGEVLPTLPIPPHIRPTATSAEIAEDISRRRARIDTVLDQIEQRLSPVTLAGQLVDAAEEALLGRNPSAVVSTVTSVVRDHPLPVTLIGVGVTWLALTLMRDPHRHAGKARGREATKSLATGLTDTEHNKVVNDLAALITSTRGNAACLRKGAEHTSETTALLLRQFAVQQDRCASALENTLRHFFATPPTLTETPQDLANAAAMLARAASAPTGQPAAILHALAESNRMALGRFRGILKHDLPPELRVTIGAQFHDLERSHARLDTLDQAFA